MASVYIAASSQELDRVRSVAERLEAIDAIEWLAWMKGEAE